MTEFGHQLLHWYHTYKRNLPWRETSDPYKIWVSEIILQQTQVAQGTAYYHSFITNFPNVQSLANASEDDILRLWQGLGYYSRARNMHHAAKTIVNKYNAKFPNTYKDILDLKGIGPYTAAAIASFSFNLPHAVLDGNVYRFLSRIMGIDTPIDSTEGKKQFEELAQQLLDKTNPSDHNQAMMEMGAIVCKPKKPECDSCPFQKDCVAFQTGRVLDLPIKSKKVKQRNRYFNYFLVRTEKDTLLINKRIEKDIWQNLYQLPLIESTRQRSAKYFTTETSGAIELVKETKHILSHQIIHARFFSTDRKTLHKLGLTEQKEINLNSFKEYAYPQLVANFLNEQTEELHSKL